MCVCVCIRVCMCVHVCVIYNQSFCCLCFNGKTFMIDKCQSLYPYLFTHRLLQSSKLFIGLGFPYEGSVLLVMMM